MKQKAQDAFDLGYMRKYKELNRISNPFAWVAVGVALLGFTLLMIGLATDISAPKEDVVYESLDGQEITVAAKGDYLTYGETAFLLSEDPDADTVDTGSDALSYTGLALFVIGALAVFFYFGAWIQEASKKAGWEAVGQLEKE